MCGNLRTLGCRFIPLLEVRFQPLNRMPPLRRGWFTDRILISEQTDFIHCFVNRHSVQPVHSDEIFRQLGVVEVLLIEAFTGFQHVVDVAFPVGCGDLEILRRTHGLDHPTDADVAGFRNLYPHSITQREQLQGSAVPATASAADESVLSCLVP